VRVEHVLNILFELDPLTIVPMARRRRSRGFELAGLGFSRSGSIQELRTPNSISQ